MCWRLEIWKFLKGCYNMVILVLFAIFGTPQILQKNIFWGEILFFHLFYNNFNIYHYMRGRGVSTKGPKLRYVIYVSSSRGKVIMSLIWCAWYFMRFPVVWFHVMILERFLFQIQRSESAGETGLGPSVY